MKQELPYRSYADEALERICEDKLFNRSPSNELLLRYLVDQAYKGTDVKEQTIGIEFFKTDYTSDQNDSKIRVAVYNLRKKLELYYAESGKDEAIRFSIEKGQYNLRFVESTSPIEKEQEKSVNYIKFPVKYLLFALVGIVVILIIVFSLNFLNKPVNCWTNFFDNDNSNICVVADHFVVWDKSETDNKVYSLCNAIKSEGDLMKYLKDHPNKNMALTDFTVFTKMAPIATHNLSQWFFKHKSDFTIRLESELLYEDVKSNNLIYIGQAKTMKLSKSLFLTSSKCFKMDNDGYFYTKDSLKKAYNTKFANTITKEYAIVSYMPLENGKKALFFVSNNDIGVIATLRNFTTPEWLDNFNKKLPENGSYFNALFEVSGVQRTDMSCKLVQLEAF